jgi:hypothetical protein
MTIAHSRSALLLDQVVTEFEAGRAAGAVLLLAGMLDAVATDPAEVAAWRELIAEHPVSGFIGRQSPALLARPALDALGAWPRQLHAAVGSLGFVRGLKARRELGARAAEAAWQQGQRIALFECGELGELDRLRGRALDNVVLIHRERGSAAAIAAAHVPPLTILAPHEAADQRFDLLLLGADDCSATDLALRLTAGAAMLAPGGSLLLSAFAPGHLGAGWQAVCMGRDLNCHDEPSLSAAARSAGLAIVQYRDSSGSLIWAALHHAGIFRAIQGESTWISPAPSAR